MATTESMPDELARVRRLLARERSVDRGAWLRLSAWGVTAVAAVTVAAYAYDVSGGLRRENLSSADLVRELRQTQQALQQQIQTASRDSQAEARRLAAAIGTLNADRDKIYTRVSSLEQSVDSVTGSLSRQAAALASASALPAPPAAASPAPQAAAPQTTKPEAGPVVATATPAEAAPPAETAVPRTQFGVDLGVAPSLDGLRALWRREAAAFPAVAALQPIVVVRDRGLPTGVGLHLVAGPLSDAAAAARLCATLGMREKPCEPLVYEGQRLALDVAPLPPRKKPRAVRPPPATLPSTAPPPQPRG